MKLWVADLGFLRWGRNPRVWGKNLLLGKIFAENCIKMKEIRPGGASLTPQLDPKMIMALWSGGEGAHA